MKTKACLFSFIFFVFLFHIILVTAADAVNKIMPLGDSITWDDRIGDLRTDGERTAYRYSLWQLLTDAGYEIDFVGSQYTGYDIFPGPEPDAENEGHPGWTDDMIADEIYQFLVDNPAKIILLHIGTNSVDPNPDGVEESSMRLIGMKLIPVPKYSPSWPGSLTGPHMMQRRQHLMIMSKIWLIGESMDPRTPRTRTTLSSELMLTWKMELVLNTLWSLWAICMIGGTPMKPDIAKMADVWFSGLKEILPQADAGPDQNVNEFDTVTLDATGSNGP